jgi:hypothetical protein
MDALRRKTCSAMRTVKPCGPDSPTLESSIVEMIDNVTGAIKPGTPGRSRSSRKTIAQGMPCGSALPDDLWAFSFSAHEDCGCG